jgi:ferredoxin
MSATRTPQRTGARLHVDWTACEARGACLELLPHRLVPDDWGYPRPRAGGSMIELGPGDLADAENAARLCPRMALTLLLAR